MPIHEYHCAACGHQFEKIQKMNAKTLRTCPECKKKKLKKLISAASFRLKGSGWYQTDFKNSGTPAATPKSDANNNSGNTE